jgi:hypothetical protein
MAGSLSLDLASAALGTGLFAAYKWYRASGVTVDFGYSLPGDPPGQTYRRMGMEFPRAPESGVPEMQRMNEIAATLDALNEAAAINKVAAIWTAISVIASGCSALAGSLH